MRLLNRIQNLRERLENALANENDARADKLLARLEKLEARAEERGLEIENASEAPAEQGIELNDIDWTPPILIDEDAGKDQGIELNDIDWTPPVLIPSDDDVALNIVDLAPSSLEDAEVHQYEYAISGDNVAKLPLDQGIAETAAVFLEDTGDGLNLNSLDGLAQDENCEVFTSGHNVGQLCEHETEEPADLFVSESGVATRLSDLLTAAPGSDCEIFASGHNVGRLCVDEDESEFEDVLF